MCFCLFIFRYNLLDRLQFLFFVCLFLMMFFFDVFGFLYYCCLLIVISVVCQNSLHSYFFWQKVLSVQCWFGNNFVLIVYCLPSSHLRISVFFHFNQSSDLTLFLYSGFRWEEGKLLLNRNNFFKDLEFYNMAEMRDSIFEGLKTFYYNPLFQADVVQDGSMAARSLCLWVRAVYDFCLVNRSLKPKRQQLEKAEQELEKVLKIGKSG